ncbi:hypothetical protein E6O75_ATG01675 [Venturia nashicola]|uniref:Uncharacterized protein n=1 Tax=Venturia nashicola TaxID=86259 RepID=A0A4Z1NDW5_9PEZI|nr:hypothetical protein E6O75_ATG01675 [Venturia nashicola]
MTIPEEGCLNPARYWILVSKKAVDGPKEKQSIVLVEVVCNPQSLSKLLVSQSDADPSCSRYNPSTASLRTEVTIGVEPIGQYQNIGSQLEGLVNSGVQRKIGNSNFTFGSL